MNDSMIYLCNDAKEVHVEAVQYNQFRLLASSGRSSGNGS